MEKYLMFFTVSLLILGCGKDSQNNSSNNGNPIHDSKEHIKELPTLKIRTKENSEINNINSINLKQGENNFDFAFRPTADVALDLTKFKGGPYLGCEAKDIGIQFNIHHTHNDGSIDLNSSLGFGHTPTQVFKDEQYILRLKLILDKDCLGLNIDFAVVAE